MKPFSHKHLRDRFTDGESLGLFIEALEYFQSYNRDPDEEKLRLAEERLKACRDRYPNDLLPLFYLGLVNVERSYAGLDEAIEIFKRVLETTDETLRLDALYNLGIAYIELYDDDAKIQAHNYLTEAITTAEKINTSQSQAVSLHAK
ncbi:MAG: tetratricopeptide repeat protein, partial [bacterium]